MRDAIRSPASFVGLGRRLFMRGGRWFWVGLSLFIVATLGCAERPRPDDVVTTRTSALTSRTATLNLVVPAGRDVAEFVLAANGALSLDDRATVAAPISNMGGAGTHVGADARA